MTEYSPSETINNCDSSNDSECSTDRLTYSNRFSKNYPKSPNDNTNSQIKELSLLDLGLKPSEINVCETIKQPPKTHLSDLLLSMVQKYEKTNIKIQIDKTIFNCHLIVLQCYSELFLDFDKVNELVLPKKKVTPKAFSQLYKWMLASDPIVDRDGIIELLSAAQFLKVPELIQQCWACLDADEKFSEDAAFFLYMEARDFGELSVQKLMLCRIWKFFLTLVSTKEFLQFTDSELCTLLQSNLIGVNSEMEVIFTAIRWLNYDWKNRQEFVGDILKCIRFKLIPAYQLVELNKLSKSQEICGFFQCKEFQEIIYEALIFATTKSHYNKSADQLNEHFTEPVEREWIVDPIWINTFESIANHNYTYQTFCDYLSIIQSKAKDYWKTIKLRKDLHVANKNQEKGAGGDMLSVSPSRNLEKSLGMRDSDIDSVKILSVSKNQLSQRYSSKIDDQLNSNQFISKPKTVEMENKTVSISEKTENATNTSIIFENPKSSCPSIITNIHFNKTILIFGGIDLMAKQSDVSNGRVVFQYDFIANKWNEIAYMPRARKRHRAVFYQSKIYLTGGDIMTQYGWKMTSTMWSYDPIENSWFNENSMPFARCNFGFVIAHLQLYAIGGESDLSNTPTNSVIRYDPINSLWQSVASMIFPRASASIVTHRGFIWVAGGRQNHNECIKSFEYYDPIANQWTRVTDLRIPRVCGKLCGIDNYLYIVGGYGMDGDGNEIGLNSIDLCDLNTNHKSWTLLNKGMMLDRCCHEVIEIDQKMIIIGGISRKDNVDKCLKNVECYCPNQHLWINCIRDLPQGLNDFSVVTF